MSTHKIHLPLNNGSYTQVLVDENKKYGNKTGRELIKLYGRKHRISKEPESLIIKDGILFIPTGILSDKLTVEDKVISTKDFFNRLEKMTGCKILSKRENRPLKHFSNVSIKLPSIEGL